LSYRLHISNTELALLINHATTILPNEAAALLFGSIEGTDYIVTRLERVHNILNSTTTFAVDPDEQYRLMTDAEVNGLELIGVFHSHPAPAFPSIKDERNMQLNPVVWLIASKESGTWEFAAYILHEGRITDVTIIS
jgi:proteasome lid subunit RPN8/RPN11